MNENLADSFYFSPCGCELCGPDNSISPSVNVDELVPIAIVMWVECPPSPEPLFPRSALDPFFLHHLDLSCSWHKYCLPQRRHSCCESWMTLRHRVDWLIGSAVISSSGRAVRVSSIRKCLRVRGLGPQGSIDIFRCMLSELRLIWFSTAFS